MKIRKMKTSDIKYFADCRKEEFLQTFPELRFNKKEQDKRFKAMLEKNTNFLLEENKKPIGFISVHVSGQLGNIAFICVNKSHRKMGYGKILMKKAGAYLNSKKVKVKMLNVTLNNKAAINLYRRMGYKPFRYIMKKVKK